MIENRFYFLSQPHHFLPCYLSYHSMISLWCFVAISFVSGFFLHIPLIHVFLCRVTIESVCVCYRCGWVCGCVRNDAATPSRGIPGGLGGCCCTLALVSIGVRMRYSLHGITVVVGGVWSPQGVGGVPCIDGYLPPSSLTIICCCRS